MLRPFFWHAGCRQGAATTLSCGFPFSPAIRAPKGLRPLWHGRQECVVVRDNLSSDRETNGGSIDFKLCAKRSVKGGNYETCKKNTFLPRGCHRDACRHGDE